jgi:uncharacterized cofD-like protein
MQYRFTSEGELNGHALGNLLLAALWDRDQDSVAGLDQVGALLKVVGRVLPMSAEPLDIEATFELDGQLIQAHGQVAVATTAGRLQTLRLIPSDPVTRPEVIQAIMEADWITMGPGSWFSSVLPHLLVPTLRDAIIASPARKVLILNLDSATGQRDIGEFAGYSPIEHCEILSSYAPGLRFDLVLTDSQLEDKGELAAYLAEREIIHIERDLRDESIRIHHASEKLASAFAHIAQEILV